MYNPNTQDNREYELYNKHTDELDNTYHTRTAARAAQGIKQASGDWSWRIRTVVL